jgi:CubicO group peptidase (beta-lactamase class C family)
MKPNRILVVVAAALMFAACGNSFGQTFLGTVNFGNCPEGLTNAAPWVFDGGAYNGTQLVMQTEKFVGPNAGDFATAPNYQGQTLPFGQTFPAILTFAPKTLGAETATFTNYETPNPPFGAYISTMQGTGVAATPASGPVVPELLPLQQAITNFLVFHHFGAGTLALRMNGGLVFRNGYGYGDSNFTSVIHPDRLFRLASCSKMLTASAVNHLINLGQLTTNTHIYSYLGISPWKGTLGDTRITNITVQELLDHSGGWNHPSGGPEFETITISQQMGLNYPAAPTNVIAWQFSKPLDFTPGTTNVYSNFGYQILGRVIEKASGMSYINYIQNVLLHSSGLINPLGFTNVIQTRSRPQDRAPWEMWFVDDGQAYDNWDTNVSQSAVDYPANINLRNVDGGGYWESYDSFGGDAASAIGLCNYLRDYLMGGDRWPSFQFGSWGSGSVAFFGSLGGITSVMGQNAGITYNNGTNTTNGVEYAALFNQRDGLNDNNGDANNRINSAISAITSWPTNGGGMIQWASATAGAAGNGSTLTVNLVRTGSNSLPVKVSYTTFPLGATPGVDYTTSAGIVSFAAGQTNAAVTVNILNTAETTNRQFSLELISASGGAFIGDQMTSIVTITNGLSDLGTLDLGNVPLGLTNSAPLTWVGGAWNGTNLFFQTENIFGPNAASFSTSPNYQGQTLVYGQTYPSTFSFSPAATGLETATVTNFQTPNPPFGASILHLQGTGVAATPVSGQIVPELSALRAAMTNYLLFRHFEAGTIALRYNGLLVLRDGYGYRDSNYTTVIHPDNLFRLASVSKALTASAMKNLVAAGKLTTNTPVYAFLGIKPWNNVLGDNRITNITVQELFDHSGGWDNSANGSSHLGSSFDPEFNTIQISQQMGLNYPAAPTNVIAWMFSRKLDFAPGTTNVYSNFGFQLLGRVIEKASGMSYINYIQQVLLGSSGVLNPIGFTNVIQSRSRPQDLAPWEIWYMDDGQYGNYDTQLYTTAVGFPATNQVRWVDGGGYWESFDSFGGLSASAVGLCNYLRDYFSGDAHWPALSPGQGYGWNAGGKAGSLPGATSVIFQNRSEANNNGVITTNGLEFAVLFNHRDCGTGCGLPDDNDDASTRIQNAAATITSWPTNGGGLVQWSQKNLSALKNSGTLNAVLTRTGGSTLPVKVSYMTYATTATSSDYVSSSGVVSFAAGQTNATVPITLLNNPANTTSVQFLLELTSASGGAGIGDQMTSIVTLLNSNSVPKFVGSPVILPGGGLSAQISASSGTVNVQMSTDLINWQLLQNVTISNGTISIIDPGAQTRRGTFYRLAP